MRLHGMFRLLMVPLVLVLAGCPKHLNSGAQGGIVRVEPLGPGAGFDTEDAADSDDSSYDAPARLDDFCGGTSARSRAADLLCTGQELDSATAAARPAVDALRLLLKYKKLPKYFFFEDLPTDGLDEVFDLLELGSPLVVAKVSKAQLEWEPHPGETIVQTPSPGEIMTFRDEVVFPILAVDGDFSLPISSVTVSKLEGTWKIASLGRRQLAVTFLTSSLTYGRFNRFIEEKLQDASDLPISEKKFMYSVPSLGELFYAACEGATLKLFPIYEGAFAVGDVLDFETVRAELRDRANGGWSPD